MLLDLSVIGWHDQGSLEVKCGDESIQLVPRYC
jgi:hypothetical protein